MTAPRPNVRKAAIWLVWLLVYLIAGRLGLSLAVVNASATPIWPPTGIAIAFLLLEGRALWPLILLGAFLVNITTTGDVWSSLGIAVGNTLEALLAAHLIVMFAGGRELFLKAANIFRFVWVAIVASAAGASVGVTVLCVSHLARWGEYGPIWTTWWLGNLTGAIIFAPFLLTWLSGVKREATRRGVTEIVFFVLTFALVAETVFGFYSPWSRSNTPNAFLWIPVLAWSAFRFGLRGASAMTVVLCPVAIWQTMHGLGPFARGGPNSALLTAQAFTAIMVITTIVIASVVRERTEMEKRLRIAQLSAEEQVRERTEDLTASNATLRRAQEQLQQLSGMLLRAQDNERRRVARNLHDSSGQLLVALSMELHKVHDEAERLGPRGAKAVDDTLRIVDELSTDIRTLSYLLHPPLLDELGLQAAVRWYTEGFAKRSGVRVDLILDDDLERFSTDAEIAVFRVLQECLTNIHLHSGSKSARIIMTRDEDKGLRLEVSDQGRGITSAAMGKPGVGISGMRERVKMLGGELRIDSSSGGTTVVARIPFVAAEKTSDDANEPTTSGV